MSTLLKNLFLLFITTLITLFIAEGMVRVFYPQEMSGSSKDISSMGYALNRSHGTVSIQQGTSRFMHYRFYPPALRDTEVNPSAKHILALGDSMTFGWLQPFKKTYLYHLQSDLNHHFGDNKYQILNAASGGWGTAECLAYLNQFGAVTHPKYVVVFVDSDDIGRAVALNIFKLKNEKSYVLTNNFHPFPHAKIKEFLNNGRWYNFLLEHSALFQLIRNVFIKQESSARANQAYMDAHQHKDNFSAVFQRGPETLAQLNYAVALGNALFYQINQWCIAHHAKLLVVTTGYNAFYKPDAKDPTQAFLKQAPVFFKSQKIAYDDIAPQFKIAVAHKVFQLSGDAHLNDFGDQTVADLVWPWMEKQIARNQG
ncbi:MAG: SGNH/GDSL hydrolase family protein [Gammaproteobacteria bacterium]|nr:SGNH/GDSL hydrolase family protein [Gammaproteobacteria bacterium]